MSRIGKKEAGRRARHRRIRKRLCGTSERPRLSVYRSLKNMYAQLIDDTAAKTVIFLSTQDKGIKELCPYGGNIKSAELLGEHLARRAREKGIAKVVFDRGGYLYHGRVKALAEGARKGGLEL